MSVCYFSGSDSLTFFFGSEISSKSSESSSLSITIWSSNSFKGAKQSSCLPSCLSSPLSPLSPLTPSSPWCPRSPLSPYIPLPFVLGLFCLWLTICLRHRTNSLYSYVLQNPFLITLGVILLQSTSTIPTTCQMFWGGLRYFFL